jgi:hypothetical protein
MRSMRSCPRHVRDSCLLGPCECDLCFTRRGPRPLTAGQWRTLLGPVSEYESGDAEALPVQLAVVPVDRLREVGDRVLIRG